MRHVYRVLLIALLAGTPLAASAQQAFTVRDTEVFAGPSSEFPPVAVLPPNAGVRIAGCLTDWSWCDVIVPNLRGWVYAADLVVPYQNNRVAVIEYGPQLGLVVVTFSLHSYWDHHYRGRPWYREREQWASRVRIEGDRGGPPPKGRAAQTERGVPESGRSAPGAGGKPPAAAPRPQEGTPPASRGVPESGKSPPGAGGRPPEGGKAPPGAGGKPPEAGPRSGGAQKKDPGARGGDKSQQGGKKDRD